MNQKNRQCCCGNNPFFTTHSKLKCSNTKGSYVIKSDIEQPESGDKCLCHYKPLPKGVDHSEDCIHEPGKQECCCQCHGTCPPQDTFESCFHCLPIQPSYAKATDDKQSEERWESCCPEQKVIICCANCGSTSNSEKYKEELIAEARQQERERIVDKAFDWIWDSWNLDLSNLDRAKEHFKKKYLSKK